MIELFIFNLKNIIKNKLIVIYLFFFVGVEAVLLRFALMKVPVSSSIHYASSSNILSIIFFIFFIIYSYESFINIKEVNLFETFSTHLNGLKKVWVSRLILLFLLAFISTIPLFIHYTIIFYQYDLSRFYFANTIESILLNFLFVAFIGVLIGALFSVNNNRLAAYIKAGSVVFLASPLLINLISGLYSRFGSIESFNIFPLVNRVQILAPNLLLGSHSIYGLPVESIRWEAAIMWIIILTVALLSKITETKERLFAFCVPSIIILWVSFALIITPNDSLVRKDDRFFQGGNSDWQYDTQLPQQERVPNFTIDEYIMEFKVRRQLYGDVEIVLGSKSQDNIYNFTLYRGYKIKRISDNNGNELSFKRDGHYISISANQNTDTIKIKYSGNGNKFYSNNRGIALIGGFPYYPVAGYTAIPIKTTNNNIKFSVSLDTKQEVFSNIDGENNYYSGTSDTLTLVSGFLKEYYIGDIKVVGYSIYNFESDLSDLPEKLVAINKIIGTNFDIEKKELNVFFPPDSVYSNDSYIKDLTLYDNQIITRWTSSTFICRAIIENSLPSDQDTTILRLVFLDSFLYLDLIKESEPSKFPTKNEVEIYKNPSNENFLQKEGVIKRLLLYQINTLGEEVVFSQVYDYLKNYDGSVEQLDFLLEMEQE